MTGAGEGPPIPPAALRIAEALIYASAAPVPTARLSPLLPEGVDPRAVLHELAARSAERGVVLTQVAGGWAFRTAPDLAPLLTKVVEVPRRLPRAALEALAIVAWHQPVTRPEIEEIRGTSLAQTTLETLLDNGLIAPRGKKEAPGRPTLWGTTPKFLDQFGLNSLRDLPRREELLPEPGLPFPAVPTDPGLPPAAGLDAGPVEPAARDTIPDGAMLGETEVPEAPAPNVPDAGSGAAPAATHVSRSDLPRPDPASAEAAARPEDSP